MPRKARPTAEETKQRLVQRVAYHLVRGMDLEDAIDLAMTEAKAEIFDQFFPPSETKH